MIRPTSRMGRWFGWTRFIVGWVRESPVWIKALLGLAVLGILVGGVVGYRRWERSSNTNAAIAAWKDFEAATRTGDKEKMTAALDAVLKVEPDNEMARLRKKALGDGEAPANDEAMIYLTLKQNLRDNKLPEAVREADKWLTFRPNDWLAHCVKASYALSRGERAAAIAELDALPRPDAKDSGIEPGSLLFSFRLYRAVDRDVQPLRNFVQEAVTGKLKTPSVQQLPPNEQATLLECYFEGFDPITKKPQPVAMLESFAAAMKVAFLASEEAIKRGEPSVISRVARLGDSLMNAVAAFRLTEQISEEQAVDFRKEIDANTEKLWRGLQSLDAKNADSYVGLAMLLVRTKDYTSAREMVTRGLQVCGEQPDLARLFSRMLQLEGKSLLAYSALADSASRFPDQPIWWAMAAEAGMTAGRRDLALNACAELRKIDANNRWALRTEAKLWIEAGDANKAAQLLYKVGLSNLAKDPESSRIYTQALSLSGLGVQIVPFLEECEKVAVLNNTPLPVVAVLRGWVESRPTADALAIIQTQTTRALDRWPAAAELYRVQALALSQVAETLEPKWDSTRVSVAIQAAERFLAKVPGDREIACRVVTMRIYGQNNPEAAYRDATPLRDAESDPNITADELELLGTVYRLVKKYADAERVLRRATQLTNATAGVWVQLALTYDGLDRKDEARQTLRQAQVMPRTPQEQTDYVAAARTLYQEMR